MVEEEKYCMMVRGRREGKEEKSEVERERRRVGRRELWTYKWDEEIQ